MFRPGLADRDVPCESTDMPARCATCGAGGTLDKLGGAAPPCVAVGIDPSRAALQIATRSPSGERRREHRVPLSPAAVGQLEEVLAGEPAVIAMEGSHSTG